ncbi:hypothetical protein MASR2M70_16350 [Bacillota bacterium]
MPEGIKAGERDVSAYKLKRKQAFAHSSVGVFTISVVVIGAVPIPFSDSALLAPVEIAEINLVAQIYGIKKDQMSKQFVDSILQVGVVTAAAKTAISFLKAIPGINLAASLINSIIAGTIIALLGEGCIYIFEQIYLGEKSIDDVDWVTKVMEAKFTNQFMDIIKKISESITENMDKDTIIKIIGGIMKEFSDRNLVKK